MVRALRNTHIINDSIKPCINAMSTTAITPCMPFQHLRTTIQLNAHLTALRYANRSVPIRYASGKSKGDNRARDQPKKKKKARIEFKQYSLKDAEQFSLCDAIR